VKKTGGTKDRIPPTKAIFFSLFIDFYFVTGLGSNDITLLVYPMRVAFAIIDDFFLFDRLIPRTEQRLACA
jgi:hypothetical protein